MEDFGIEFTDSMGFSELLGMNSTTSITEFLGPLEADSSPQIMEQGSATDLALSEPMSLSSSVSLASSNALSDFGSTVTAVNDLNTLSSFLSSAGQISNMNTTKVNSTDESDIARIISCQVIQMKNNSCYMVVRQQTPMVNVTETQTGCIVHRLPDEILRAITGTTTPAPGPTVTSDDDAGDIKTSGLSTLQEIEALEASMKFAKNKKKLATEFQQRGGKSPDHHLTRALSYLMTVQLASKFSWAGIERKGNGKRSFKTLKICNILIDSLLEAYHENCTRLKMENSVKEWLKRAGSASKKKTNR